MYSTVCWFICCLTAVLRAVEGVRYMVVDCGGGTVDITVHEMDSKTGKLNELHKATGGPHGSTGMSICYISSLCMDCLRVSYSRRTTHSNTNSAVIPVFGVGWRLSGLYLLQDVCRKNPRSWDVFGAGVVIPYEKSFAVLQQRNSWPHQFTFSVHILWISAAGKWMKQCVVLVIKKLAKCVFCLHFALIWRQKFAQEFAVIQRLL